MFFVNDSAVLKDSIVIIKELPGYGVLPNSDGIIYNQN